MPVLKDIHDVTDIRLLVNKFLDRIIKDELLSPVFNEHVKDWAQQKDAMYRFWENALLKKPVYEGSGLDKHENLQINNQHFYRWVTLFNQTVDENFKGELADNAKYQALNTAEIFRNKTSSVRF